MLMVYWDLNHTLYQCD